MVRKALGGLMIWAVGSAAVCGGFQLNAAEISIPSSAPTTRPAHRTAAQINAELDGARGELHSYLKSSKPFIDPALRAQTAPKAIPLLKKLIALSDELSAAGPEFAKDAAESKARYLRFAAMLGDPDSENVLTRQSKGENLKEASQARWSLYNVAWYRSIGDAAAQTKILDELEAAAKTSPDDTKLAQLVFVIANNGATTPALAERAAALLSAPLHAGFYAECMAAELKQRSFEGKPLVIKGVRTDQTQFTTEDWKGKVILVDFWATWCGPCVGELPRVKKAYADFHARGFEVLGVSCDDHAEALNTFLKKNPDMPWPQLFDASKPGWHELATGFGINGIPTMFLIDKHGILRSVSARAEFEEMIPKLLEEK